MAIKKLSPKKLLTSISVGVVLILLEIWVFTQIVEWRPQIIVYLIITALVFSFGTATTEKALLRTQFLRALPRMFVAFIFTFLILTGIAFVLKGEALPSISTALASVPIALIIVHGFIIAQDEELVFRGWIPDQLRKQGMPETPIMWITSILFALFHWTMAGGFNGGTTMLFLTLIPYTALGILFYTVGRKYSPQTQQVNAGCHWAYNVFILAFGVVLSTI